MFRVLTCYMEADTKRYFVDGTQVYVSNVMASVC